MPFVRMRSIMAGPEGTYKEGDLVETTAALAKELRVRATPTVFFGRGNRLDGALPYEAFLQAARAAASGETRPEN